VRSQAESSGSQMWFCTNPLRVPGACRDFRPLGQQDSKGLVRLARQLRQKTLLVRAVGGSHGGLSLIGKSQ
jgi:hypothetical protein